MIIKNITITDMETSGHGSAQYQKRKILVLGVFPGDSIDIFVYKKTPKLWYAETVRYHHFSHLRERATGDFPSNIPWLHLSPQAEITFKDNFLLNTYQQLLEKDTFFEKINRARENFRQKKYRNKVAYAFTTDNRGLLNFALYSRGTSSKQKNIQKENDLVHENLEKAGKIFLNFFNQNKLQEKNIKYLILRYSYYEQKVVAHILVPETNRKKIMFSKKSLVSLISSHNLLKGVLVSYSPAEVRSARTHKDFYEIGDITSTEEVLGKKYSYHPSLFFQIYPKAFEEILIDLRNQILQIQNHKTLPLLDLFSGIGIIGLEVSDLVKKVTGVELSSFSKTYADQNAQANNITNATYIESSVDMILSHLKEEQILIVDPTRSGLSQKTITAISEVGPRYVFYISCNPSTQARDIEKLQKKYNLIYLKGYNLFPKTHHLESMAVLQKK